MPFSHHSHSGQFCNHATDDLAACIAAAKAKGMTTFALTEHIPRPEKWFYPGEGEAGYTLASLETLFDEYMTAARQAQREADATTAASPSPKDDEFNILVGFEGEWIGGEESAVQIRELVDKYRPDFFVGSVHHVRAIPIDFDKEYFQRAVDACGGTEVALFTEYFDAQYEMLQALKPRTVGHLDLIRLLATNADRNWETYEDGAIWKLIVRNLTFIKEYGGLVEINTSAWRKGLLDPYPRREIARHWINMGGDFVLSDDSHGVSHVATNYHRLIPFLEEVGARRIAYLTKLNGHIVTRTLELDQLKAHRFFKSV